MTTGKHRKEPSKAHSVAALLAAIVGAASQEHVKPKPEPKSEQK